jgi:hypothetical protein
MPIGRGGGSSDTLDSPKKKIFQRATSCARRVIIPYYICGGFCVNGVLDIL